MRSPLDAPLGRLVRPRRIIGVNRDRGLLAQPWPKPPHVPHRRMSDPVYRMPKAERLLSASGCLEPNVSYWRIVRGSRPAENLKSFVRLRRPKLFRLAACLLLSAYSRRADKSLSEALSVALPLIRSRKAGVKT
jgi:hypothetical protein